MLVGPPMLADVLGPFVIGGAQGDVYTGGDVEAKALRARGWSISAIARHLGRDRKTVRAYVMR